MKEERERERLPPLTRHDTPSSASPVMDIVSERRGLEPYTVREVFEHPHKEPSYSHINWNLLHSKSVPL